MEWTERREFWWLMGKKNRTDPRQKQSFTPWWPTIWCQVPSLCFKFFPSASHWLGLLTHLPCTEKGRQHQLPLEFWVFRLYQKLHNHHMHALFPQKENRVLIERAMDPNKQNQQIPTKNIHRLYVNSEAFRVHTLSITTLLDTCLSPFGRLLQNTGLAKKFVCLSFCKMAQVALSCL